MSDFDSPPTDEVGFFKKPKKHGRDWIKVEAPELPIKFGVADTHAHINMLNNPKLAFGLAKQSNITFIQAMCDPLSVEGVGFYDERDELAKIVDMRLACGVHPHYSKDYSPSTEAVLIEKLKDPRTSALGEVGLDYHYDFSPRPAQIEVFERQIEIAQEMNLPIILHVREAFDDAYSAMNNAGWNDNGVLLHCYTSDAKEIERWVDAGCYVAFGGAFTFKKSDDIRQASHAVPLNRLLSETDAPFMGPEPFRGVECTPAHTIFVAQALFDELHSQHHVDADEFFAQLQSNAQSLLNK